MFSVSFPFIILIFITLNRILHPKNKELFTCDSPRQPRSTTRAGQLWERAETHRTFHQCLPPRSLLSLSLSLFLSSWFLLISLVFGAQSLEQGNQLVPFHDENENDYRNYIFILIIPINASHQGRSSRFHYLSFQTISLICLIFVMEHNHLSRAIHYSLSIW